MPTLARIRATVARRGFGGTTVGNGGFPTHTWRRCPERRDVLAQLAAMVNKSQQAIGEIITVVKYDGRVLTYQESKNHTPTSMYRL